MNNICVQYCKILRVSDSLRSGLSGVRTPMGEIFRDSSGPAPRLTQPPVQSVRGVALTTHSHSRVILPPAVSAWLVTGQPLPFILYVYLSVVPAGLRPLILHSSRHFCHIY